jgi:hypothetical protein
MFHEDGNVKARMRRKTTSSQVAPIAFNWTVKDSMTAMNWERMSPT